MLELGSLESYSLWKKVYFSNVILSFFTPLLVIVMTIFNNKIVNALNTKLQRIYR